ncbi:MAG: response regulator [Candidatus Paceibacterota bacterium]
MKILLVDDDDFLRDMYASKFISCGHTVEVADSSASTISKFQNGSTFDLLILDMVMPGTSGVELLKIIKDRFDSQLKYSIFLSNQGQDEDIEEATQAGAIGYIIKAHSIPSEVVQNVEKIVNDYVKKS